jgi:hypothetical protein
MEHTNRRGTGQAGGGNKQEGRGNKQEGRGNRHTYPFGILFLDFRSEVLEECGFAESRGQRWRPIGETEAVQNLPRRFGWMNGPNNPHEADWSARRRRGFGASCWNDQRTPGRRGPENAMESDEVNAGCR